MKFFCRACHCRVRWPFQELFPKAKKVLLLNKLDASIFTQKQISKEIENRAVTAKPNFQLEYIDTEAARLTMMLNEINCTENARLKNLEPRVVCAFEIEQFAKAETAKVLLQNKLKQLPESDIEEEIRLRIEVRSAYPSCK